MNHDDRKALVSRYEERFKQHGVRPESLGWSRPELQAVRFSALAAPALARPTSSVLDVGCGFADLYDHLTARGWRGTYTGVDIVGPFLEGARRKHPELRLVEADFSVDASKIEPHDFVVSSGIFNGRLAREDHGAYVEATLHAMFDRAQIAVCADFLSTWVNYQKPENWHADPGALLAWCRKLTRRIALRHDYLPFEFALFLFRDDRVTDTSLFASGA